MISRMREIYWRWRYRRFLRWVSREIAAMPMKVSVRISRHHDQ